MFISGSGKTFTLLTLAYTIKHRPIYTIIFKNDLLVPFERISKVYSVAQFFMEILQMNYMTFINFVEQLSGKLTRSNYVKVIAELLAMMRMIDLRNVLVFIDEYTVINKSLLFVLLIIFKHYKVGCVISGDRNQLQTIKDSKNTKMITSFHMVSLFADKIFNFTKNERCGSVEYNDKIKLVSKYSNNQKLNDFGYALTAALLFDNIYGIAKFDDTFLASTHRSLSIKQHTMVIQSQSNDDNNVDDISKIHTSFYTLNCTQESLNAETINYPYNVQNYINWGKRMLSLSQSTNLNNRTIYPFKFLAYLPLHIGSFYYVFEYSESCIGQLVDIDLINNILTLKMCLTGEIELIRPSNKHERVIFEEHLNWLKENSTDESIRKITGKIVNYPIYPARFMTIHRCQGCTITDRINIDLCESNFQALYVAMSRIKSQNQIITVTIPKQLAHALTVIINFKEYSEPNVELTVKMIESKLNTNYHFYKPKPMWFDHYLKLVLRFVSEPNQRRTIREEILCDLDTRTISKVIKSPNSNITETEMTAENDESLITFLFKNIDILKRLSLWNRTDRFCWLHEWMRVHPDFVSDRLLTKNNESMNYTSIESLKMLYTQTHIQSLSLMNDSKSIIENKFQILCNNDELIIKDTSSNKSVQAETKLQQKLYDYLNVKTDESNEMRKCYLEEMLMTVEPSASTMKDKRMKIMNKKSIRESCLGLSRHLFDTKRKRLM